MRRSAILTLADGSKFFGYSFGVPKTTSGEVVFNTGMVGYPEALTDPSYRGQILVLTNPLIGNYGVPFEDRKGEMLVGVLESDRVQVSGLVVQNYSENFLHWASKSSLGAWLKKWNVPAIMGVDTRALTMVLREKGVMIGSIGIRGRMIANNTAVSGQDPNTRNLVAEVSCKTPVTYKGVARGPRVLLYDCGTKLSIIRALLSRDCTVIRVPWNYDSNRSRIRFDGVVISNGPGDPKICTETIKEIREVMNRGLPILGICLGSQLLALAVGADTYKLKYGHRSQNQPCAEVGIRRCYITTQNHGYAVKRETLPRDWRVWFENANDKTIEGIRHCRKPWMAVQFHPEAHPGPTDTEWVFDEFLKQL